MGEANSIMKPTMPSWSVSGEILAFFMAAPFDPSRRAYGLPFK